jgi:hypothetical protein
MNKDALQHFVMTNLVEAAVGVSVYLVESAVLISFLFLLLFRTLFYQSSGFPG